MSRNILDTSCKICHRDVVLCGEQHAITRDEAGVYFDEYMSMVVADAVCKYCDAKYLAWVVSRPGARYPSSGDPFYDLSFRKSFNDEPAPEDLPTELMLQRVHLEQVAARAALAIAEIRDLANDLAIPLEEALSKGSHWESYRR